MIIFLITEPGNTKENCGNMKENAKSFSSKISCFRTFFFFFF